jgi:hypothetical protein
VITHPAAGVDMRLGRRLDPFARQPQPLPQRLRIGAASRCGARCTRQRAAASRCTARRSRNTAPHCRSTRLRTCVSVTSSSRRITETGPAWVKLGAFDLPRRRATTTSPLTAVVVSMDAAAIGADETITHRQRPRPTGYAVGLGRLPWYGHHHRLAARPHRPHHP